MTYFDGSILLLREKNKLNQITINPEELSFIEMLHRRNRLFKRFYVFAPIHLHNSGLNKKNWLLIKQIS